MSRGKSHPGLFLSATNRIGVLIHRCVALEDSHNGVRAAVCAGTITMRVPDLLPSPGARLGAASAVMARLFDVLQWARDGLFDDGGSLLSQRLT